jgi:FKBP-type peptidyl-prolyl cis-trans isomerase SlyD
MRHSERSGKCALVHYRGGAAGESPIEDFSEGKPVEIHIGTGAVPPGIDDALYEMEIGEQATVKIPPAKAYGEYDPQGVQVYPRSFVSNGDKLVAGAIFAWTNPASGREIPVKVADATKDYVKVDFNHPLAGKEIEYWIELVDVL